MRLRLMLSMLVVVGITISSVVGFAMFSTQREVNTYMFRGGMFGLNNLVDRLEEHYAENDSWVGADSLQISQRDLMMGEPGRGMGMMGGGMGSGQNDTTTPDSDVILTDADGNALRSFRGRGNTQKLSQSQLSQAIALKNRKGEVIGYLYTDETAPIQPGRERDLTVRLFTSVRNAAFIGIGIAILSSLLLGYWFLKPIQQLTRATAELGRGDLNQRVAADGKDELAQLGKTFNQMAESLQRAEASRKAMTADIAHELRTPLAVQRATVEAMMDGIYPLDQSGLQPLVEQNALLTRLVEDLRTLALADAGELRLEMVPTDLVRLANSVFHRFQSQADQNSIVLQFASEADSLQVSADPIRLEQILTNLMGNALRYTPTGGTIQMSVRLDKTEAALAVKDSGPGIPPDSLNQIFDRFYRVDRSRSREEGGSGLGLAIARQLARAQAGDLTARNHPEGGAEFILTLPFFKSGFQG